MKKTYITPQEKKCRELRKKNKRASDVSKNIFKANQRGHQTYNLEDLKRSIGW